MVTGERLGSILRSDLNGSNIVTLIPNAYVYDLQVTSNYIYFADNNFNGGIKRANFDGSGVTNLVSTGAVFNGICVTADAIYWSAFNDADGGGIRRANLNGSNPTNLYNAPSGTSVRGVVVIPDASSTTPPLFASYVARPGEFAFTLQVESGRIYGIETSGNLTNWTEITNFASTGITVTLTNVIPVGVSHLFFRARTP